MPEEPTSEDRFEAARRINARVFAAKEEMRAERRAMSWPEKIRMIERAREDLLRFKKAKRLDLPKDEDA